MKTFYADFETTVYEEQKNTEVWCGAIVEHGSKNAFVFRSMKQFFELIDTLEWGSKIYFHNLKFDGTFILSWLESNGYKKDLETIDGNTKWVSTWRPKRFRYTTYINDKGIWYDIRVRTRHSFIIFKDSLKLLPFSVSEIGKAFNTEHRKTEIDYVGKRSPDTPMTKKEKEYVKNDVFVVKEAMEMFRDRGFTADTIGGCALSYFIKMYGRDDYNKDFPNLYDEKISCDEYGAESIGKYILKSYCGAFVYVNPEKEKRKIKNGITLDVTSLYPSVMHSQSGINYPIGKGILKKGKAKKNKNKYYFQRLICEFKVKDGYLPFIKIRNSYDYNPRECLKTSDITCLNTTVRNRVELTLTQTELDLFFEHYDVIEPKFLDYCEFYTKEKIFDMYIDYWLNEKNNAINKAQRTISKLFLNSLYGKFAARVISSFKIPYLNEEELLKFTSVHEEDAKPGYIPVGSAIISEARCFTVKACQANYYGVKPGFCYCDTDSMHLDLKLEDVKGCVIAKNKLSTFKHESSWDFAFFDNAKRYIEHIVEENGEKVDIPYHSITCAGLPDHGKLLLRKSLGDKLKKEEDDFLIRKMSDIDKDFLKTKRDITCFTKGLRVPGKLMKKNMPGGIVLYEDFFTIRK